MEESMGPLIKLQLSYISGFNDAEGLNIYI